jgi:hypothetical protein
MSTATVVSTVPGAIGTLQTHFDNVAAANPTLNLGVFVGDPTGELPNNYLMIGSWPEGNLIDGYEGGFPWLQANGYEKSEDYKVTCHLRVWGGDVDQLGRLTDAFTVIDGVLSELTGDVGGSSSLSSSGSWQVTDIANPLTGPMGAVGGWGLIFTFDVHVVNVRLSSQ